MTEKRNARDVTTYSIRVIVGAGLVSCDWLVSQVRLSDEIFVKYRNNIKKQKHMLSVLLPSKESAQRE